MELAEAIRQISRQQTEGTYPATVLFGTIENVNPVNLKIGKNTIPPEFITLADQFIKTEYDAKIMEGSETKVVRIIVDNSLKVNDKVIVLRQQGGQNFIILDRIGG